MKPSQLEKIAINLLKLAATVLPQDVKKGIEQAIKNETNATARNQLENILENVKLAKDLSIPICQDTGIQTFYITVGSKFPLLDQVSIILENAIRKATKEIPLRPNTVDPLLNHNPGDNMGHYFPIIHWKIVKGSDLELTVIPKGGGSENMCKLAMLNPSEGIIGMKKFVIDSIIEAGAKPCPPTILGIGIGGGADTSIDMAKEQLFRPVGQRHPNNKIAELEMELLNTLNQTGIGPMGLGGDTTVLDVHIEVAMRHPASFPVGLAIQCWAARRASAIITQDGKVTYTSHEVIENSNP